MANLLDSASILLTPTAYNNGSILAIQPSDGSGDFTFSRGSSATRVNAQGLIEDIASNLPRIDYTDGCGSWLLEPQRTNLLPYSEAFDNAYWTKSGSSVVSGFVSPSGDLSAFKLVASATTGQHILTTTNYVLSVNNNSPYNISIFVKAGEYSKIGIREARNNGSYCTYNLSTGSLIEESGTNGLSKIESFLNGWYKITLPYTTLSLSQSLPQIFALNDNYVSGNPNNYSYTGDGASGIYIWGGQLEQGSYPTSYIPTSGSTVTRAAEICNGAGTSDTFNASEGVLFVEMAALGREKSLFELISLSDGTTTNRMYLGFASGTNKLIWLYGANVFTGDTTSIETTNNNKIAFKFKDNDFAIWVNGVEIDSQLSGSTFSSNTFNTMGFDSGSGSSTTRLYANLKQLMTFNKALTDSELEDLTSWDSFIELAQGQQYKTY